MIDPNTVKAILDLGIPTAVIVILLVAGVVSIPKALTWFAAEQKRRDDAFQALQGQLVAVVTNNTQALTRLCDGNENTANTLEAHDQRAQRIESTVTQVARVTDRIEQKLDAQAGKRSKSDS